MMGTTMAGPAAPRENKPPKNNGIRDLTSMVLTPSHEDNAKLLKHARVPVRLTRHMDSHSISTDGIHRTDRPAVACNMFCVLRYKADCRKYVVPVRLPHILRIITMYISVLLSYDFILGGQHSRVGVDLRSQNEGSGPKDLDRSSVRRRDTQREGRVSRQFEGRQALSAESARAGLETLKLEAGIGE